MRKIWIDCDTGSDDAAAIALAFAADKDLQVLGISTCMGNLEVSETFRNTLQVVTYLRENVPVAKGSADPIVRKRWVGRSGEQHLNMDVLPEKTISPCELDAVSAMIRMLKNTQDPVTLIPLAPLTNIAKLMMSEPKLVKEKVESIILMGGGMNFGNTTGAAELNFYADPEAAAAVFAFGIPIVMCGLDVCYRGYITREENEMIGSLKNPYAQVYYYMTKEAFNYKPQALIYDSMTIMYALHPELFTTVKADIRIETGSELCDGASICDTRTGMFSSDTPKIHTVVLDVDRDAYVNTVYEILKAREED